MELPENNIEYDENQSPKNNKSLVLGLFVILAIIFVIPAVYFLAKINNQAPLSQMEDYRPERTTSPVVENINQASLTFLPSTLFLSQNSTKDISLAVDTAGHQITAAEVYLNYDPTYLEVVSINPGNLFDKPNIFQQRIDNQAGLASFALGTFNPKTNNGNLINVVVKTKNITGNTRVNLSADTKMAAKGELKNILGPIGNLNVVIN